MDKLRVLIVDDSALYRKILIQAVTKTNLSQKIETASNGLLALEFLKKETFDVVLLDIIMPEMDGITTLKTIIKAYPNISVIMISSSGGKNAKVTIQALEIGALDFIAKPLDESYEKNMEIIKNLLRNLFITIKNKNNFSEVIKNPLNINKPINKSFSNIDLILIASSTGGPTALENIFSSIKNKIDKPILVVQHMPPNFTKALSLSLNKKSNTAVMEAYDGADIPLSGAIIAKGGFHMIVSKGVSSKKIIRLISSDYVNGVRPSADVLFKSVSREYPRANILSIILTGMGSDGMEGIKELKASCNCHCICQSEKSCVVYGMSRSVIESGLCDEILDLDKIAMKIEKIVSEG